MARRALFLDRDGVINVDHGYVYRQEDFVFIDGIFELVAHACKQGYLIIVVTNQAGIGRGYYTEEDFWNLMAWVGAQFESHGGRLDRVYFCPTHPEHGVGKYRCESDFRKPGPGMILQAAKELCIDLTQSILIGDKKSDVEAGVRAGIGTIIYLGNEPCERHARWESNLAGVLSFINNL